MHLASFFYLLYSGILSFSRLHLSSLHQFKKPSCLHYKDPCKISEDDCCGNELLGCEAFKDADKGKIYYCASCLDRKCGLDEHCCDSRLVCRGGRCKFPIDEPCELSKEAEDSPDNCFNSFMSCSKGLCKPCGGRKCETDNDCCISKFYKCDNKLEKCVKFRGCQESGNACLVNEDCCEPMGCKENICQGCLRYGTTCNAHENCCNGLYCNGLSCDYLKEDGASCVASFECKSTFCRAGNCGPCAIEGNDCESALECCDSMLCTTKPGESTTICSPKKLCAETDENCEDLQCCDGLCKKGKCHECLTLGNNCDPEDSNCCPNLICTTNPDSPKTSICSAQKLCIELGDECNESSLKCCAGVCFKGGCTRYKKEKQSCSDNTAPCEPHLQCSRVPLTRPPQFMCSAGKLCVDSMRPCESLTTSPSALPCCDGDCYAGKCMSCLPEASPCELDGLTCCESMACVTNPMNPSLKLCSPRKLCLEYNDDCPADNLKCCSGKCQEGKCRPCLPIGKECELQGSACCGSAFCTDNPQLPGKRLCALTKLCSLHGENCSPGNPCCNGACFKGRCQECTKSIQECGQGIPDCCHGNKCVTNPEVPSKKLCSPVSLCVDVGDNCNPSTSKCCQGHCQGGKCVFCLSEGEDCTNEQNKCCPATSCLQLPFGDGKKVCAAKKMCQQTHEVCDNKKKFCCTGVCHRGFCELCRKEGQNCGDLSPSCCEEFECKQDPEDKTMWWCEKEEKKLCKKLDQPCSTDEQCCQGLCNMGACVECIGEGSECDRKSKNICCGIMKCVTDSSGQYETVCSPKTLCAAPREACNEDLKCCKGICFANHCTQCKSEGMRCGMLFAPCCEGLKCVTNPKAPSHKLCMPHPLCVDIGEPCNNPDLKCCEGICFKGKCVNCKIEWEECVNEQCCNGLKCVRDMWEPDKRICSKSKLCSDYFEDCSTSIPCCDSECFQGKCYPCRAKGNECGKNHPHCCDGLECYTDKNNPDKRICDTSAKCIDLSKTCEQTLGLPCCKGICFKGICRYCTVSGKKCGDEEPPCCDGLKCVTENINGKHRVCQPEQKCMEKFATCHINGQSCCSGLKCSSNVCQNCLTKDEVCTKGLNSKKCCFGFFCDLRGDGETYKCSEIYTPCIYEDGRCGFGHEAKECCGSLSCFKGKCRGCRLLNATCLHDYDCCEGLRCSLAVNGTHSRCLSIGSCKNTDEFCNYEEKDGCCTGLTCWQKKCKDCLQEHYQCDHQDEQRKKCCDGLFCTWRPDGKYLTCEKKPLCIMNDSPCSRNDSKCCTDVCWNGKCRGCLIHNKTCENDEKGCCDPLICTWNVMGTKKICNFTKPFCIEKFGICREIGCCDGSYCDSFAICRPCKSNDEQCEEDRECCEGTVCTISSDGKKKFCRESIQCIEIGGVCSNDLHAPKCCKGLKCWQGQCELCVGCQDCDKEIVLCDFISSNNFVQDIYLSAIKESDSENFDYSKETTDEGLKNSRIKSNGDLSTGGSKNIKGELKGELGELSGKYDQTYKIMNNLTNNSSSEKNTKTSPASNKIEPKPKETKQKEEKSSPKAEKGKEKEVKSKSTVKMAMKKDFNSNLTSLISKNNTSTRFSFARKLNRDRISGSDYEDKEEEGSKEKEDYDDREENEGNEDDDKKEEMDDKEENQEIKSEPNKIKENISSFLSSKRNLTPEKVSSKLDSLLSQIKGAFSASRFLQKKKFSSKIIESPEETPDMKAMARRIEAQEEKKKEGMEAEEAKKEALNNRNSDLEAKAKEARPSDSGLKPCCPGLFCSYHTSGAFTYCTHKMYCVVKQGSCSGPGSRCCGDLKCINGVCSECSGEGELCEHKRRCCGRLICTFSSDGKFRVCMKSHNCIAAKGECNRVLKNCCPPMTCWQGECRVCQKYKAPCSEEHPCCDSLHCKLDPGGIHKYCTYDPEACIHSGGKCDVEGSECCADGFCNAQKVCQQCFSEGDRCEKYPDRCCKGLACSYDKTGKKKLCLRNPSCVDKDGSCAEPISCLTDEICCHGLICNTQKKCRPPFLMVNEDCRFDTSSHKTEIEAPVFFSGEENMPIEPCRPPLVCAVDMTGEKKICQEQESCVVLDGSCAHPESKCCPASYCDTESQRCLPCGTAHSSCDEENICCKPLVCSYDPMGYKRMCMEKEQCIMKHGLCDGKGAFCCDGYECMKDPKSVKDLQEFEKKMAKISEGEYSFREKYLPSKCLDCLPYFYKCDPDAEKKCCDGLICGITALGHEYECMENPKCLTDMASCALPGADCCPGYLCNGKKKCQKCLKDTEECLGEERMCCEGTLCRIDETGQTFRCSSKPICIIEGGSCEHIDSRCCEGMFCNRNSTCEKYKTCLEQHDGCLDNDRPLPCCPPTQCFYHENGKTQSCEIDQPCIIEGGHCGRKGLKCCDRFYCDKGKCVCSHEGEFCSEEYFCCGDLKCALDQWGGKRICSENQMCILEGGNCTVVDCCEGLICEEKKAKPVLDSNGTTYTPNRTDLVCEKPETCVAKAWHECSPINPCCDHLMCTFDVFEKGEYCHPKATEGTQCLLDSYCNFLYMFPNMKCLHNICTPVERKCAILAESCSHDDECCYGYSCVMWGDQRRCKKKTGYRCEYEDDCEKFCDPMRGVCCDEPV